MHIVVFPGWYPSKTDKLSGDFVQRHMYAISKFCKVSVVIAVKDATINKKDIVTIQKGNLTEIFYYYPSLSSIKWIDNILSFIRYNYICISQAQALHLTGKISLVHLYVLQKNHLLGMFLKWKHNIPFVVSEQSTLYIDGRFDKMNAFQQRVFRAVFHKAIAFHGVSKYLVNTLKNKLKLRKEGVVIPNVVDADLFYYNSNLDNNRITFVHVSNMSYQKNVEGMLAAFAQVKKKNKIFHLNLVGPLPASINSLIDTLDLASHITLWNEKNYAEVADIMARSDVFVFFTRYETFGCVIIEANACGLPLIISDLEVTRELVSENFNGVFVESENVNELTDKIVFMIDNPQKFDPLAISLQTRSKFNYERIGQQFLDWYTSTLHIS